MEILRGWIRCSIQTMFTDVQNYPTGGSKTTVYNDQQVLLWSWTNAPALLVTSTHQYFSASWNAQGSGSKSVHIVGTAPNGMLRTQDGYDTWTTNCSTMLQLDARQTASGILLSSQETYPANGYTVGQTQFIDGIQQGPTNYTSGLATALAVSINWSPNATSRDRLEQLGNSGVTVGSRSSAQLGSHLGEPFFISRIRAPVIHGAMQDILTPPRGPDAPFSAYPTIADWSWQIGLGE